MTESSPSRPDRSGWVDITRGAVIIGVIIGHTIDLATAAGYDVGGLELYNDATKPFRMSTMMFLAGWFVARGLRKPARAFLLGKVRTLAWPFLVWSVVTLVATGRADVENLARIPVFSPTYLWFLWFLGVFSLIALVVRRRQVALLPLAVVAIVASSFLPESHRIARFAFLLGFYLLGWWVSQHRVPGRLRTVVATIGLAATAIGVVAAGAGLPVLYAAQWAWSPAGFALALVALSVRPATAVRRPAGHVSAAVQWVGRQSMVFYVTHMSVLSLVLVGVTRIDVDRIALPLALSAPIAIALALAAGAAALRRYRWVDAVFAWPSPRRTPAAGQPVAVAAEQHAAHDLPAREGSVA